MGLKRHLHLLLAFTVASTLGIAAPASAEDEPANDTLPGAEGPLLTGTHSGTIRNGQDAADWYYFYVQPQVELTIEASSDDCGEYHNLESTLYGRNGYGGGEGFLQSGTYSPVAYTTPPGLPQLYYYVVKCDDPESATAKAYSFEVSTSPSQSLISGPVPFGAPVAVGEPNEFREQALGPLAGGITYQGVTGTENDEDWFYFYTKPQQAFEISATSFDPSCSERDGGELEFYPDGSDSFSPNGAEIDAHSVGRVTYTSEPGYTKHHISAGCWRSSYAFRIDPPSAVASENCIAAISGRVAAAAQARSTKRKLRRVKRRHRVLVRTLKRRIRHKRRVKAAKRTMRRAKRRHRKRVKTLKPRAARATVALHHSAAVANATCA
jgi:hypothetical protein